MHPAYVLAWALFAGHIRVLREADLGTLGTAHLPVDLEEDPPGHPRDPPEMGPTLCCSGTPFSVSVSPGVYPRLLKIIHNSVLHECCELKI